MLLKKFLRFMLCCSALIFAAYVPAALAEDAAPPAEPHLDIQNHRYVPDHITVPAGVKFKLTVKNNDSSPEEFESFDLDREKIVAPGQEITVFLGPLDPGDYKFFGDFHQDTAQGVMTAK